MLARCGVLRMLTGIGRFFSLWLPLRLGCSPGNAGAGPTSGGLPANTPNVHTYTVADLVTQP